MALASLGATTTDARGATVPSIDAQTWAPSTDSRAGLVLEPTATSGPWVFAAGASLDYAHDPVTLRYAGSGSVLARPVSDALAFDAVASLGLGRRVQVGLRIPTVASETGTGGLPAAYVASGKVPASAFGDVAVGGKATIVSNELGGLGLAALGELTLPTGTRSSFASEGGPTVTARLVADVSVLVASLQASLGYDLHTTHTTWPAAPAAGAVFGDSIPWTLGLLVRPAVIHALDPGGRQSWEVALHGSLPAGPVAPFGLGGGGGAALSPVLLAVSDRVGLGRYKDAFALVGIDLGLDHAVGVPDVRVTVQVGFRLADHDRDRDGVADDLDQCPTLPEDHDGFEDEDGCPEADNDDDGIVDGRDACPDVPGPPSPDPRQNGCPMPPSMRDDHAP
jgi:hypothetical protein